MVRDSSAAPSADTSVSDIRSQIIGLLAGSNELRLADAMAAIGRGTGLDSSLWWISEDEAECVAAHPEDLDWARLAPQVKEWGSSLEGPLSRSRVDDGTEGFVREGARAQVVWPFELDARERGLWVVEGADEAPAGITTLASLLRLGLQLHRASAQQALQDRELAGLRSEQQLMEQIVDALPVGLYVVDQDYRIVAWNRKREAGTQGVAREDAIGRSVFDVLYRQPEERLREEIEDVFTTGEIRHYEVESTASGETRYYRLSKVPMRLGGTADVTHVITIGEDITERKRISERISHAEKLAALGQMAAGVMHEINNPLATIAACAEALSELTEQDSEAVGLLSMVETEVDRCQRIARDLLAFSRPPPSEKGPVDAQETVEETLKLLRHHDRFKKIRVQREYVYDLPLVWANAERLIQVFVALALNALDAMDDDGDLRVRTEMLEEDAIAVSFIDTGCGIPPAELSKIFEPFYTSKPPGKGTGLGLSICYGIIAEHGGRIEVDSKIGVGSNFRVVLPAYRPSDDADLGQHSAGREES